MCYLYSLQINYFLVFKLCRFPPPFFSFSVDIDMLIEVYISWKKFTDIFESEMSWYT